MSSMKKTKEGINLKKLLRLKNTGSIFVIAGLLMIFVIASYTYILQSSYTKTALETEITRDIYEEVVEVYILEVEGHYNDK